MTDSLIDDDSAEKVGQVVAVATGEVYRRDWQRWAAAVGDHNPLWFDPEYARAHGYRDIVCPPLYLQYAILGVATLGGLRPDGSSGAVTGSMAFPRAPRRMAGGESTTFHLPAYHGDEVEMTRTVDSIAIGFRHRQDLGDIDALMRSIDQHGLLQPITITPDGVLVCGRRRLEAVKRMGWRRIA